MRIISVLLPSHTYILRVLLILCLFLNLHLFPTPLIFIVQLLSQLSLLIVPLTPALPPTGVPHLPLALPLLVLLPLLMLRILVVRKPRPRSKLPSRSDPVLPTSTFPRNRAPPTPTRNYSSHTLYFRSNTRAPSSYTITERPPCVSTYRDKPSLLILGDSNAKHVKLLGLIILYERLHS